MTPQQALNILAELANAHTGYSIQGAQKVVEALQTIQKAIAQQDTPDE